MTTNERKENLIEIQEEWADFAKLMAAEFNKEYAAFDPDKVKVGDVIEFYHRPYQHSPAIRITKVNRVSWKGEEIPGSYRPGTVWTVHKQTIGLRMSKRG